jgi:hypothetical protein
MADSADDSRHQDAAILAVLQLCQIRLDAGPINGGEADELLRFFLELIETCASDVYPALKQALARSQKLSLPHGVLDELTAADVQTRRDIDSANAAIEALCAAGEDKVQILRRGIATMEHISDEARSLTRRIDRLIEEAGSRSG